MSGVALNAFNSFVSASPSVHIRGETTVANMASQNTYWLGRLLQGKAANKKVLRGGSTIKQKTVWKANGTGEFYLPGAPHSWQNPQRLDETETFWRFGMVHMSWVEQEILLNDVITSGTEDAIYAQFADLRDEKETIMWTEKWDLLENSLFAVPDATKMEGEGPGFTDPYSLFAFVNEDANGLFGENYTGNTWTQVHTVDPTAPSVNGNYTPQQATYASSTAGADNNIVSRLDELFMDVHFEQPPTHKEYFENDKYGKQIILTSKRGRAVFMNLLRNGQDHFVAGPQDPAYPNPQMHGVPVTWSKAFGDAAVYDDGSNGLAGEFTATNKGPRFMLLNTEWLYPTFHKDRYFEKLEVTKQHEVPDTWVCPVNTYYNLFCPSRRHQGHLAPVGNIYTS